MERTKCKLRTWLTDSLGSDNAHGFAHLHHSASGQVAAVALHADTMLAFASEHRANFNALDGRFVDDASNGFGYLFASGDDKFARCGVDDIVHGNASEDTFVERGDNLIAVFKGCAN